MPIVVFKELSIWKATLVLILKKSYFTQLELVHTTLISF